MSEEKPAATEPKANGFIIVGFLSIWAFGLLPGLMGAVGSYSATGGFLVVVLFGVIFSATMALLWRQNTRQTK